MAGAPLRRERVKALKELGPEGEEQILVWLATGKSVRWICHKLGLGDRSTWAIYKWRDEDEQRKAAWAEALAHRADYLAEESLEIADDVVPDSDSIRKAELQIKVRQWLSAVSNPDRYGKDRSKAQVHIEHLHLTAVQEINAEIQAEALKRLAYVPDAGNAAVEGEDYEVVGDGQLDDLL